MQTGVFGGRDVGADARVSFVEELHGAPDTARAAPSDGEGLVLAALQRQVDALNTVATSMQCRHAHEHQC